jgi:hypothetical protein
MSQQPERPSNDKTPATGITARGHFATGVPTANVLHGGGGCEVVDGKAAKVKRTRRRLVLGVLLMLVLYVLSIGPAVYIVERTGWGETPANIIYGPLIELSAMIWNDEDKPVVNPLFWYCKKWGEAARR